MFVGRTTTAGVIVLPLLQRGLLLSILSLDLPSLVSFFFQLCTMSGRRTTCPEASKPAATQRSSPRVRERNRNGDRAAFGPTRARDGGRGGELGDCAGGSQRIVSSTVFLTSRSRSTRSRTISAGFSSRTTG